MNNDIKKKYIWQNSKPIALKDLLKHASFDILPVFENSDFIIDPLDHDDVIEIEETKYLTNEMIEKVVSQMALMQAGIERYQVYFIDALNDQNSHNLNLLDERMPSKDTIFDIKNVLNGSKKLFSYVKAINEELTVDNLKLAFKINLLHKMLEAEDYNLEILDQELLSEETINKLIKLINRCAAALPKNQFFYKIDLEQQTYANYVYLTQIELFDHNTLWNINTSINQASYSDALKMMTIYLIGLKDELTRNSFANLDYIKIINPRLNSFYTISIKSISDQKWALLAEALLIEDFDKLWKLRTRSYQ
ncbi:hypothetical protein [Mycoplasmopsis agassizii]|uniref:Uncharacterized protein n=1 Tax=Mycoplasmopsis agassizii TaxID=33922 RepID=A0ABX4H4E4_9BACT|nr:hypothetical protein [Mycoplasmopsis agassizii]PAF54766.1 hypothetical protein CJF60_03445 [Mycoplasmopsis agassizii]SMC19531.1 hypothetical protein SAMN02745179_00923 [Mycoplasmopsis agassizii]